MRCFRGNTWNARLFTEGTDNCPTVMSAERRRWCSMLVTSIFPHRPADEADNDWSLVRIAFRSSSLRIERIATLLPNLPGIRPKKLLNYNTIRPYTFCGNGTAGNNISCAMAPGLDREWATNTLIVN